MRMENKLSRAALFDWIVFMTSFSLSFVFPGFVSLIASPSFPWLIMGSIIFYALGAWLKHLPLDIRADLPAYKKRTFPLKYAMMFGHWLILYGAMYMSRIHLQNFLGIHFQGAKPDETDWYNWSIFFIAIFITWLVYRAPRKNISKNYSEKGLFKRELTGDILLCLSVSVLTFFFWERGVMGLMTKDIFPKNAPGLLAQFIVLAICFVLFYLPLRYLFLIEDHSSRQTWQRFILIFGFLAFRFLFILLDL